MHSDAEPERLIVVVVIVVVVAAALRVLVRHSQSLNLIAISCMFPHRRPRSVVNCALRSCIASLGALSDAVRKSHLIHGSRDALGFLVSHSGTC